MHDDLQIPHGIPIRPPSERACVPDLTDPNVLAIP